MVHGVNGRRLFIFVTVPDGIKQRLRTTQHALKEILAPASTAWTVPPHGSRYTTLDVFPL